MDKPKRRSINEIIYGIQASKDVKLANIARALDEDISLIKTVGRLSRQITSKDLTLVVIKGMGKKPLMLLSNLKVETAEDALKIMEIYLTRWKCEESFRFIKEAYQLEDVRVLKYEGLRNLASFRCLIRKNI